MGKSIVVFHIFRSIIFFTVATTNGLYATYAGDCYGIGLLEPIDENKQLENKNRIAPNLYVTYDFFL